MNYNKYKRIKAHKEIAKSIDKDVPDRKQIIRMLTTIKVRKG